MDILIISGSSGSGKSSCLRILEDLDYHCIDNLPLSLIEQLPVFLLDKKKIAISIDIRNLTKHFEDLNTLLEKLKKYGSVSLIYLDSEPEILIERFHSTRRKHPLSTHDISLVEALKLELEKLEPLIHLANYIIDTSYLSIHEFYLKLKSFIDPSSNGLNILFQSFGFKYGPPKNSDFVFDVRSLPNPYWDKKLRPLSGLDSPVIDFLKSHSEVENTINNLIHFIEKELPLLKETNRHYLTISIGCTGGHHRSPYISQCLYEHFKKSFKDLQIRHRDLAS